MVFARIVYKTKSGWRTGKHVYYCSSSRDEMEEFAKKNAKGREYRVQTDFERSHIERMIASGSVCFL